MRTITAIFAATIAILIGALMLQPAIAAPAAAGAEKTHHRHHHDGALSASEAAKIAQKQDGGGRVLSVEHVDGGYRVKLLKKGEVRSILVPTPTPEPAMQPAVPATAAPLTTPEPPLALPH